jgi:Asp-tRNA(Asn)/Glu-tRNA(Gln) amidotransferase A subunit family amidase
MTLAWTQDTVGPMCRSAEDCALVLDAISGVDGKDNTVVDVPFNWDASSDVTRLRVGYQWPATEGAVDDQTRRNDENALQVIRSLGVTLVPFALPEVPIEAIDFIRYAETAAAFDDVTRAGVLTETENGPEESRRPDEIRSGYFIPAVEYIQANRLRMRVMEQLDQALGDLDMFIGSRQALTNRTGHPVVSVPNGFANGSPTALHLTGKLFGEQEILRLAHAFQSKTDFHLRHPKL